MPTSPRIRVDSLTGLRFFAAFIVVIFHFGRESIGARGAIASGPQMVTLFFVLSGFVMMLAYGRAERFSARRFWRARMARIVPVYLLALGIMAAGLVVRGKAPSLLQLLLTSTLVQSWFPGYSQAVNSPGWSLSVEAFFYGSFPFLLIVARRLRDRPGVLLLFAGVVWSACAVLTTSLLNSTWASAEVRHELAYYFPLSHLGSFLLGVAIGTWFVRQDRYRPSLLLVRASFLSSLLISVWCLENREWLEAALGLQIPFGGCIYAPLFAWLIVSLALDGGGFGRVFSWTPLVRLGEASYSLYILQMPVRRVYEQVLEPRIGVGPAASFWLFCALLVLVSLAAHRWFELPMASFLRRWKATPRTHGAPPTIQAAALVSGTRSPHP